ncbi:MAG: hypothetical protein ACREC2_00360, partial [Bradyrhizobium sp.]
MRTWMIRLAAVWCALALFSMPTGRATGGEPGPDCGNPSDIHDGWATCLPEQQGFDPARLCAMGK